MLMTKEFDVKNVTLVAEPGMLWRVIIQGMQKLWMLTRLFYQNLGDGNVLN